MQKEEIPTATEVTRVNVGGKKNKKVTKKSMRKKQRKKITNKRYNSKKLKRNKIVKTRKHLLITHHPPSTIPLTSFDKLSSAQRGCKFVKGHSSALFLC